MMVNLEDSAQSRPLAELSTTLASNFAINRLNFDEDFSSTIDNKEAQILLSHIISLSPNSIFILDDAFRYIGFNDKFLQTIGLSKQQLLTKPFTFYPVDKLPPWFAEKFQSIISHLQEGKVSESSLKIPRSGKQEIFIELLIKPYYLSANRQIYLGFLTNLTDNVKTYEQFLDSLNYDKLTGLQNRDSFYQSLTVAIQGIKQQPERIIFLYVLRLNIDKLFLFNETLGTQQTDILLKQLVNRLQELVVENIGVKGFSRFSGGDFAIFIRTHDIQYAYQYVQKITELLEIPFFIDKQQLYVKLSIGLSQFPQDSTTAGGLIAQAEKALDKAYLMGGNTVVWYDEIDTQYIMQDEHLLSSFHRALNESQIVPFFQPKILFSNPYQPTFEALVRWQHPKLGMLTPNQFLSEVLDSLSQPLFENMLLACIDQICAWKSQGFSVVVCVNVDARQLMNLRFVEFMNELLKKYPYLTSYIQFELTEIANLANYEVSRNTLNYLHELGFQISLDDFGVGFSTLDYLVNLPINGIKIDKSFCDNIMHDRKKQSLVKAIIAMAHTLELDVIAEGIETKQQYDFIKDNGGDGVQGYYIHPSMCAQQSLQWLQKNYKPEYNINNHWQALISPL